LDNADQDSAARFFCTLFFRDADRIRHCYVVAKCQLALLVEGRVYTFFSLTDTLFFFITLGLCSSVMSVAVLGYFPSAPINLVHLPYEILEGANRLN